MTQYTTENLRAPPMRHHGITMARHVSGTYEMCNCLYLFCSTSVTIHRNIYFSNIFLRTLK